MMDEIALASMEISSARMANQYAMSLQKLTMSDMEQQAISELEMLPAVTAGVGDFIDTYA